MRLTRYAEGGVQLDFTVEADEVRFVREEYSRTEASTFSAVASQRSTHSSRFPGKQFTGAVHREVPARHLVRCESCGCYRWNDDLPHAVRNGSAEGEKVDCVGRKVA